MSNQDEPRRADSGAILVGLVMLFAGLAILGDRIGISGIHVSGRFWPLVLIAFGSARFLAPPRHRDGRAGSRWTGVWFIYLGLWFFVNEFHLLGFRYGTSWPLLIVGAGIGIIWRAIEGPDRQTCQRIEEN
jgi:hypothetical protein